MTVWLYYFWLLLGPRKTVSFCHPVQSITQTSVQMSENWKPWNLVFLLKTWSFSISPLNPRLCVLRFDSMMASTIPPHFKFKVWNNHPHPNTHLDVIAVRPTRTRRSPTASFCSTHQHHLLHHHIFNHKSSSIRTVLTRVSGDGGGIVDAASQQSASAVSSELFFLLMFMPLRPSGLVIPRFPGFSGWEFGIWVLMIPCLLRKGLCPKDTFFVV